MLASAACVRVLEPPKAVKYIMTAHACATGHNVAASSWVNSRLHSLVSHVHGLGSPLSCDFKNEVMNIQQHEAFG